MALVDTASDLGEAVGMSGPALYNYVRSKDELLQELLVDASSRLLDGAREIVADPGETTADTVLERLVAFHIDFATSDPLEDPARLLLGE